METILKYYSVIFKSDSHSLGILIEWKQQTIFCTTDKSLIEFPLAGDIN